MKFVEVVMFFDFGLKTPEDPHLIFLLILGKWPFGSLEVLRQRTYLKTTVVKEPTHIEYRTYKCCRGKLEEIEELRFRVGAKTRVRLDYSKNITGKYQIKIGLASKPDVEHNQAIVDFGTRYNWHCIESLYY